LKNGAAFTDLTAERGAPGIVQLTVTAVRDGKDLSGFSWVTLRVCLSFCYFLSVGWYSGLGVIDKKPDSNIKTVTFKSAK